MTRQETAKLSDDLKLANEIARKSKLTEKDLEKIKPFVDEDMREHGRKLIEKSRFEV